MIKKRQYKAIKFSIKLINREVNLDKNIKKKFNKLKNC